MKLGVIGSRTFIGARLWGEGFVKLDSLHARHPNDLEIWSGECSEGADQFAKWWARQRGVPYHGISADWRLHGKRAGMIRNEELAKKLTHLLAFWDGQSRGTKHMIQVSKALLGENCVHVVCFIPDIKINR